MKDYNSYEFTKVEIINLNDNKNKLLRKYISNLNKKICEFHNTIDNHCDSFAKSKKQISKMFFSLMEMISKKIEKYNKVVKLIYNEIENLTIMLERSIRVSIESDYDRYNENERYMSNSMSLDQILTLYTDIKIVRGYKEIIKIDDKGNKHESQTFISGSFDKINYFKSDAIKLRITNYTNDQS
jgi:hypothetical protein